MPTGLSRWRSLCISEQEWIGEGKAQSRNSLVLEARKCESKHRLGVNVEGIEKEPFANGPNEVAFTVYQASRSGQI